MARIIPRRLNLLAGNPRATYLNDHLAGATAGLELARRAASNNRSNEYGAALSELAQDIQEDREALEDVMSRLDVGQDQLKLLLAWGAEKARRAKPNGGFLRYSPLSRLEELELLLLGVNGKLALWRALRGTMGDDPRLSGTDFEALITRADSQRRRLEHQRLKAAHEALAADQPPA